MHNHADPHTNATSNFYSAMCNTGDIRLVGGSSDAEGRVEVCMEQRWGSVCDNHWNNAAAVVACKQLGFHDTRGSTYSQYTMSYSDWK